MVSKIFEKLYFVEKFNRIPSQQREMRKFMTMTAMISYSRESQ